MKLASLMHNNEYNSIIGLDLSTNSAAFSVFLYDEDEWSLNVYGKIDIGGSNIYQKCSDLYNKTKGLAGMVRPDMMVIESSIYVNNNNVMKQLSMIMGCASAAGSSCGSEIKEVSPITWQSYVGNKAFTKEEKDEIKRMNPGASASHIKTLLREERKMRTIRFVNEKFGRQIEDNDVTDAICIGYYGCMNFSGKE